MKVAHDTQGPVGVLLPCTAKGSIFPQKPASCAAYSHALLLVQAHTLRRPGVPRAQEALLLVTASCLWYSSLTPRFPSGRPKPEIKKTQTQLVLLSA